MTHVIRGSSPRTIVVVNRDAVERVSRVSSTTEVNDRRSLVNTTDNTAVVEVASRGVQGPRGAAGTSDSAFPPINFAFGDASPATVLLLSEDMEICAISLQVEEAFDGTSATVRLGVSGQAGLLMDTWQSDLATEGVYETSPREELAAGTEIIITIVPGSGASTGRGQFVISAVPSI